MGYEIPHDEIQLKMKRKLPKLPSKLIRVALNDLAKAEKAPYVKIDMDQWVTNSGRLCMVCLAGAVMRARTKDFEYYQNRFFQIIPSYYDRETCKALAALNEFRKGIIYLGLKYMGIKRKPPFRLFYIPPYSEVYFTKQMNELADRLEKEGL